MIKQFFSLMKRYIAPYRKYLTWALILNFVSQWLNVFSFMAIIPILNILFKIDTKTYEYIPMDFNHIDKDVLINNAYYWISHIVQTHGAFLTLVMLGISGDDAFKNIRLFCFCRRDGSASNGYCSRYTYSGI